MDEVHAVGLNVQRYAAVVAPVAGETMAARRYLQAIVSTRVSRSHEAVVERNRRRDIAQIGIGPHEIDDRHAGCVLDPHSLRVLR